MDIEYDVSSIPQTINLDDSAILFKGEDICLSKKFGDIVSKTPWYKKGYEILSLQSFLDFNNVKLAVNEAILKIIKQIYPTKSLNGFKLEHYHKFINEEEHIAIDKILKRLYPKDFTFDDKLLVELISNEIKIKLDYSNKILKNNHWIIIRINLPNSQGFNPPHKDIYQYLDYYNEIPRMINAWIPICGVNAKTGLPIVPGSHLINENKIERTKAGTKVNGKNFYVNCIKSWEGRNKMVIASPKEGEILIFSSNLIHGLGKNNNTDETRISLEFRLHESK